MLILFHNLITSPILWCIMMSDHHVWTQQENLWSSKWAWWWLGRINKDIVVWQIHDVNMVSHPLFSPSDQSLQCAARMSRRMWRNSSGDPPELRPYTKHEQNNSRHCSFNKHLQPNQLLLITDKLLFISQSKNWSDSESEENTQHYWRFWTVGCLWTFTANTVSQDNQTWSLAAPHTHHRTCLYLTQQWFCPLQTKNAVVQEI